MGVTVVRTGYPLGQSDVLIVVDAPDDTTAAGVLLAVTAGGAVRTSRTTRFDEWLAGLRQPHLRLGRPRLAALQRAPADNQRRPPLAPGGLHGPERPGDRVRRQLPRRHGHSDPDQRVRFMREPGRHFGEAGHVIRIE